MPVAHWPELTGSLSPSAQHRTDLERKVDATSIFNATVRVAIGPPFRLITAPHQCLHAVQSVGDSPLAGELIGGQQSRGAEVSGHETGGEPTDWESWSQSWKHHHLLGLELHSAEEIQSILDLAELFAQASQEGRNRLTLLRGFTVADLFFENSTTTIAGDLVVNGTTTTINSTTVTVDDLNIVIKITSFFIAQAVCNILFKKAFFIPNN